MTDSLQAPVPQAPMAPKRPVTLTHHGDERIDEWHWLREKNNPEVIAQLEAENAYTQAMTAETKELQQQLYDEIVSRVQETDMSVPVRKNGWWYYQRTEEGKQYSIHTRRPDHNGEPADLEHEQVLFDENIEAGDSEFFDLGTFDVNPDGDLLAYSIDRDGDELFELRVRDLRTGTDLADRIDGTQYGSAWGKDQSGSVLFYTRANEMHRSYQVWRHRVGTDPATDELVFQDDDERFFVGVGNTKTDDYIMVAAGSSLTSEVHVIAAGDPMSALRVIEPRRQGIEYSISHHRSPIPGDSQDSESPVGGDHGDHGDRFFILTNEDAPNFKLMVTNVTTPGRAHWQPVLEHRSDVKLDGVDVTAKYLILAQQANASAQISILDLAKLDLEQLDSANSSQTTLEQDEEFYTAYPAGNVEFDTTVVRFEYTSLVTPRTLYDHDLATGERTLRKRQPVLGGYDPANYISERLWATANDGTRIPISLVRRRDRANEPGPALLYGYGSYEISINPTFSSLRLSLLDRGFAFAIAHVRGGGDMGRLWYEQSKFLSKRNTFSDFIACAEHLENEGVTSREQLVIRGGSAGGLLMGDVVNERPELFAGVVAEVPFVDVLTTMLDPTLPLTVHEYEEWGNPQDPEFYTYMKSYSPYDNVRAQQYPAMLVTGGLNDPRVAYWEPVKWVARLRDRKTDTLPILLKMEMGAGHMGPSGRYDTWREEAFIYSFILQTVN